MNANSESASYLFDELMQVTGTVDYGYTMAQRQAGVPIPPQGARFDIFFDGEVVGERLKGTVAGVDYVKLNPDGTALLHVHAHITTHDGCHIAVHAEGTGRRRVGSSVVDLRETMSFATAADSYRWLNGLQGVSSGFVDMENGRMDVRVFRAQARTVESSVGALEG